MRLAAVNGHLEVLQWVRENGATGAVWNETRVRRHAAGPRKQLVLTWQLMLAWQMALTWQLVLTWLDELSAP